MKSLQRQQQQCHILISEAEKTEKRCLNQWKQQQKQVSNAEQQLQQLRKYAKGQAFSGAITTQQLVNRAYFSQQLIQVINTQETSIKQLKQQSERAHQLYLQAQNKRKILEKYQNKLKNKQKAALNAQEQKAMDEWVSNKFATSKK